MADSDGSLPITPPCLARKQLIPKSPCSDNASLTEPKSELKPEMVAQPVTEQQNITCISERPPTHDQPVEEVDAQARLAADVLTEQMNIHTGGDIIANEPPGQQQTQPARNTAVHGEGTTTNVAPVDVLIHGVVNDADRQAIENAVEPGNSHDNEAAVRQGAATTDVATTPSGSEVLAQHGNEAATLHNDSNIAPATTLPSISELPADAENATAAFLAATQLVAAASQSVNGHSQLSDGAVSVHCMDSSTLVASAPQVSDETAQPTSASASAVIVTVTPTNASTLVTTAPTQVANETSRPTHEESAAATPSDPAILVATASHITNVIAQPTSNPDTSTTPAEATTRVATAVLMTNDHTQPTSAPAATTTPADASTLVATTVQITNDNTQSTNDPAATGTPDAATVVTCAPPQVSNDTLQPAPSASDAGIAAEHPPADVQTLALLQINDATLEVCVSDGPLTHPQASANNESAPLFTQSADRRQPEALHSNPSQPTVHATVSTATHQGNLQPHADTQAPALVTPKQEKPCLEHILNQSTLEVEMSSPRDRKSVV